MAKFYAKDLSELTYIAAGLEHIELQVLLMIAKRLERGQREIGVLRKDDPRDWAAEEAEELADASVYRMLRLLSKEED